VPVSCVTLLVVDVGSGRPDGAPAAEEQDFDMFAQSRQSFDQNMQSRYSSKFGVTVGYSFLMYRTFRA